MHVPRQEVRSWRGLIEHRRRLVDRSVAVKNQVRALLRSQGIRGLVGARQWSAAGIRWLQETVWPTALEELRLGILLQELAPLREQVGRTTAALDAVAARDPRVALLQTIPGIGPRTAEAFVAYVDEAARFRSGAIGAYFGLVPREDSTGEHRRLGHITREGPATVRKLLTESVWRGVSGSARIKDVYERCVHGDKQRRSLALLGSLGVE